MTNNNSTAQGIERAMQNMYQEIEISAIDEPTAIEIQTRSNEQDIPVEVPAPTDLDLADEIKSKVPKALHKLSHAEDIDVQHLVYVDANGTPSYITLQQLIQFVDATVEDGEDGRGIVSIDKTATNGLVDTYTIRYTDNTSAVFQVTNGAPGEQGPAGDDYVLTDDDKDEIAGLAADKIDLSSMESQIEALNKQVNKFDAWYDETHHVKMTGTFTATNGGETVEIGSTINSIFTWSFSKLPTSLTVGGVEQTTPTQEGTTTQQAFTASSQTSKSFTISGVYAGEYGNETVSKTWTYYFQNRRYWGYVEMPATLDGDFIKSLTGEFATSRGKTFNLNDSTSGKYIWYAYPTRFGKASFTIGGFAGGFEEPDTISVTNGAGYTENYYLYRSTNAGVGALKVIVE